MLLNSLCSLMSVENKLLFTINYKYDLFPSIHTYLLVTSVRESIPVAYYYLFIINYI